MKLKKKQKLKLTLQTHNLCYESIIIQLKKNIILNN